MGDRQPDRGSDQERDGRLRRSQGDRRLKCHRRWECLAELGDDVGVVGAATVAILRAT
ncbi:MAG: hypothetical protein ACE5LG_05250 [Anaerolineae bacterium]